MTPYPSPEWAWVVVVAVLFLSPADFRAAARRPFLWLFVGLALVSTLWSESPRTLEAALVLGADVWLGIGLARRYSAEQIARLALLALGLTLVLHLLAVLLDPAGSMSADGQWKGLLPHKNALGRIAGLGLVIGICLPIRCLRLPYRLSILAMGALALWGSRSVTPLVVLLACLMVVVGVRGFLKPNMKWLTVILTFVLLLLVAQQFELVLDLLDRSPVLSGRVKIWSGNARYAAESLWWGHGFAHVEPLWFENTVHSHNGILSLIVQLGLVGCSLFLMDASLVFLAGARRLISGAGSASGAPLLFLLYFGLMNVVEVLPTHGGHFSEWLLYVAAGQLLIQPDQ